MKRLAGRLMLLLVYVLRPLGCVRRLVLKLRIASLERRMLRNERRWLRLNDRLTVLELRLGEKE